MDYLGISLNFASKKENFPEIELLDWTVKEHVWSSKSSMPFRQISKLMIIHIVTISIYWINDFPLLKPGAGLSNTKGPGQLFLETVVDYKKFFRLQPGEYVQVNKEDEARNTIDIDQTVGAIVLIP